NPNFDFNPDAPGSAPMTGIGQGTTVEHGGENGTQAYLEHMVEQMTHGFAQLQQELVAMRRQQEDTQQPRPAETGAPTDPTMPAGENFPLPTHDHVHTGDHLHSEPFGFSHGQPAGAAQPARALAPAFGARSSIKVDPPAPFRGERRGDAAHDFVKTLRGHMDFITKRTWFASEAERVYYASTRLQGDASKAWTTKQSQLESTVDGAGIKHIERFTLEDFYDWVLRRFEDVNAQDKRRQKYDACRQGSRSVSAYAMDLEDIADGLSPRIPDWELLAKFRSGLAGDILVEMARVRPTPDTFEEYRNTADSIDRSIRAAR
ncbi:hypothetical protein OC846_006922, partial [Tilletia horrida]